MSQPDSVSDLERLVAAAEQYARTLFAHDSTGHDWYHTDNVRRLAQQIARAEGADEGVVVLAALLHDVGDHKLHGGDLAAGPRLVQQWLETQNAHAELTARVVAIVGSVSFKGAGVATPVASREAAVVQDADRLEALGAIGIARAFAYGGARGQLIYDPEVSPVLHHDFASYRQGSRHTIQHFHEKLLLLRDRMQTATGRRLAAQRHAFMEQFLAQFSAEWAGEC